MENSVRVRTYLILTLVALASMWLQEGWSQKPGIAMIAVEGEGDQYWPRWRGPSGQGLVAGDHYPDTWSTTKNVLWKTPIPGSG